MKTTDIVYKVGRTLYVNLTNRCSNHCNFCIADYGPELWGYHLRFESPADEPKAEQVKSAIEDTYDWDELVFCGLGEPWLRIDTIVELLKSLNIPRSQVRINTNGHAFLVAPESLLKTVAKYVGSLSVSLNAPDAESYQQICQPKFKERAYPALLSFIKKARELFSVTATAVSSSGVDIKATEELAAQLGVPFRLR